MALGRVPDSQAEAHEHFRGAIAADPQFAAAYAMAAWTLIYQLSNSGLPLTPDVRRQALVFAREGARLGTHDAFALARCGHALTYLGHEYDLGLSLVE